MARIIGILLFALALWFVADLYTGGSRFGLGDDPEARAPTTERVRESVERARQESEERRSRLLEE